MKKLLVICGTGVATSTVVAVKIKDFLLENEIQPSKTINVPRDVPSVRREVATNWFKLPSSDAADSSVQVSQDAIRPFVVQCWLDDSAVNRPYPKKKDLLAHRAL
jgi:hypothetical protein